MVEDSKFSNTILTNIGHQMLTSISSGNRKITYTKAEAYTQDVSSISNETLQALTSLQGKQLSANLLVSNDSGNVVTITANFRNKGLTNDVVFNSIGWFAKLDTDDAEHGITANQEYLIGITPANGAQTLVAPPADQSASQTISLNLNMTLSDATNVNMTVSDAGAVHFNQLDDQLAKYTTTSELTKLLAGKADLGLSYTKAELDAKLLDLTADTNGKVSADQVQALIADKANISDVYTKSQVDSALSTRDAQISTKANASDVYTKSQIDSDFSARDTQINTKANASDVYTKSDVDSALATDRGRLGKLEGAQTVDSPDFNTLTDTGVYYITNNNTANIKNNPVSQWGVLVVSNGNGGRISQVYYPDDGSPQWCRLFNGSTWLPWYQLSTKKDVSNATNLAKQAQATANTKADQTSLDATNQTVATKANSSDVNNQLTDIKNNFINTTGNEVDNQTVKCSDYLTNTTVKFNSCTVSDAPSWFASQFVWLTVHKFDDNTIIQKLTSVNLSNKGDVAVRTVNSKGDVTRDWRLFATNEDINNLKSVVDTKADITAIPDKTATEEGIKQAKELAQEANTKAQNALDNKADKTTVEENLATKANQSDLDQTNAEVAKKADATNPNLFIGSKDFTGNWINLDRVKQKDKYLDFTAIYDNWAWNGISQYIDVKAGETFTASMYTKANTGTALHWYTALNTDNEGGHTMAGTSPSSQPITATGDWQRTSFTFTATSDGTIKPRIENDGSAPFWIAGMKLEKGSVATDWCPALEDYAWESDITNLQNTINQQNQTIQSLTTRLTNAENEISYIKANYIEGKQFPASQEAQAVAWEQANPQGIAFITSN